MGKHASITRRDFLKYSALSGAMLGFKLACPEISSATPGGFKALICFELLGGCDNFLFSIPTDNPRKNALINRRGPNQTAYYSDPNLLQVGYGTNLALHPSLAPLQPYLNRTRLTLGCANAMHVGPSGSHEIQQIRMALGTEIAPNVTAGWKARMFDAGAQLIGFSGARSQDFQCQSPRCQQTPPFVTDELATYRIDGVAFDWHIQGGSQNAVQVANTIHAISQLTGELPSTLATRYRNGENSMLNQVADVAVTLSNYRSPLYDRYDTDVPADYGGGITRHRFRDIAMILNRMRAEGSTDRVVFVVPHGSYDMHQYWNANAVGLMNVIGPVLRVFLDDCAQMGIAEQVVVHTETEFGRQLGPNGVDPTSGTDHGDGFTALTVGGRINGGPNCVYGDVVTPNEITNLYSWPRRIDSRALISDIVQYHLELDPFTTAFPGHIREEFSRPNMSMFV